MMRRRAALVVATAALGAAVGVIPSTAAAAAPKWRCHATPLSGTVLGQPVPAASAGSLTNECVAAATLPALELPSLLRADALSGLTSVSEQGAFAAAGLATVKVGSIPVPVPSIPIPEALTKLEVRSPVTNLPLATVDLTPAIQAIESLPSRSLLDLGVLASSVTGTCQGGRPVITGASRVLNGEILGLPIDASKTVDTAVNLVDTQHLALSDLDLQLADVTLLGGVVNVGTGQVLELLRPVLGQLPPLEIPAQVARVKLTGPTQQTVDGMLVQQALRAEISLAGQSLADLAVGRAAVGAGDACAPPSVPDEALECTKRKLTLIDVLPEGNRVRLYGAADESLRGRTVRLIFQATGETVARAKVRRNGLFSTTAPMPDPRVRDTNRARYIARVGREKSLNLKLMRRMVVDRVRSRGRKVTIVGRVVAPLAVTPQTITLKRRVTCREYRVVKRFKPAADGTFRVTARSPRNLAATTYRLETQVRESYTNPKLYPTYTLPRAVDL